MQSTPTPQTLQSALVIDDDHFSQAIFRKNLEQMGFADIVVAGNGREAVQAMDAMQRPPDFLICDIFMPDMDGIEFIRELTTRGYQGGLILVTGINRGMLEVATEIATLNKLRLLGTFNKPVRIQDLREVLGLAPA